MNTISFVFFRSFYLRWIERGLSVRGKIVVRSRFSHQKLKIFLPVCAMFATQLLPLDYPSNVTVAVVVDTFPLRSSWTEFAFWRLYSFMTFFFSLFFFRFLDYLFYIFSKSLNSIYSLRFMPPFKFISFLSYIFTIHHPFRSYFIFIISRTIYDLNNIKLKKKIINKES